MFLVYRVFFPLFSCWYLILLFSVKKKKTYTWTLISWNSWVFFCGLIIGQFLCMFSKEPNVLFFRSRVPNHIFQIDYDLTKFLSSLSIVLWKRYSEIFPITSRFINSFHNPLYTLRFCFQVHSISQLLVLLGKLFFIPFYSMSLYLC